MTLRDAALMVRERAYAPYSRFKVGAALRSPSGAVHVGCNVENVAYPEGTCAEAGAIAAMWGGWGAGLLVWTIGPIALVVNPVMWAGFSRVRDREDVLQARHDAGEKPRRTPSKWW
jgi:hypothetical protein